MEFLFDNYLKGWKKSFDFKGIISRNDYWYFVLTDILIAIVFLILVALFENYSNQLTKDIFGLVAVFWYFIGIIPRFSITVRRLHDMGKSGRWIFLSLIPFGSFFILYWTCQPKLDVSTAKGEYYIPQSND